MQINDIELNKLKPFERNAKKHDERQIKNVMESIKQFGFAQPIVIDKNNVVIIGHCRLIAAKRLRLKTVPTLCMDDLNEEQVAKLRLLDNKLNESEWDFDLLAEDIPELDFSDFDIDWGLPEDILDATDVVEDDVPDVPEEPKSKIGQLWKLGNHRLICGDSTDKATIARLMDGAKADMVFTDPPYGMKYTSHWPKDEIRFEMLKNDDVILDFFPCVMEFSNGFVFVCTTWKVLEIWLPLFKKYLDLSNMIIWNKGGGGIGDLKTTFAVDYEIILVASRKNQIKGKRIGSVWDCGRDNAIEYKHPTQKPTGLSSIAITHTTEVGQKVLDLFGGSGSTLIACEQLRRTCYMCELDPKYVDVIIERWEKFTGNKAELISEI